MAKISIVLTFFSLTVFLNLSAADWPMWGGDPSRNMVSQEKGLPSVFDAGKFKAGSEEIDLATTKNVKWVVKLGTQTYGNPTVSGGRVFLGTNNEVPRDSKHKESPERLWGPLIHFPWSVMGASLIWLVAVWFSGTQR